MGKLLYGDSGLTIQFDDRTLAHIQVVIGAKLRRHESFFFGWVDSTSVGSGRSSLWLSPGVPLIFMYSTKTQHPLNRLWLEELSRSSNSATGMFLMMEPDENGPGAGPVAG